MKIFKLTLFLALFTLLSCNNNDDGFFNSEFLSIPNLVTIETQPTYTVNDYIYVNSLINRLQSEANQSTMLDLRKSTGNADSFNFTYLLERKVGTDWILVEVTTNNSIIPEGHLFTGGFYDAYADFDTVLDAYKFRAGIKLENSGEYRLSFGYNSANLEVDLRSTSTGNNFFLNISSATNNLDSLGYYYFTVN